MNDRTLVKLRCNKEMLDIRTVSWTRKSPYSFSILRSELQQLEQRPQNRLISGDCGSFAVLRLTQRPGDMKMLEIRFTWLQRSAPVKYTAGRRIFGCPMSRSMFLWKMERIWMAQSGAISPSRRWSRPVMSSTAGKISMRLPGGPFCGASWDESWGGISSGVEQKRSSFLMMASLTASFLKNTRFMAEGSAAASSWIAPRIWQRLSTAYIPKQYADFV